MSHKKLLIIMLLCVAVVAVALCIREPEAGLSTADTEVPGRQENNIPVKDYQELGKVMIPSDINTVGLDYEGFYVAFNPEKHQPNYVAWVLTEDHIDGPYSRNDVSFMPDENVEGAATLADYRSSGFDRGHMAPAADMKWSRQAMADCHLLTNMCPQDKRLNSGAWATVEKNTRRWVQKHGTLVIVAGPVLSDRLPRSIGKSRIPVPERFFKVVIAPDANPPLGIGFIMPNGYVEGGAQSTVTSIDRVETVTSFDFFSALPDSIENEVESQNSLRIWNK